MNDTNKKPAVGDEIRLKDILQTFWRRKVFSLGFVLLATAGVGAATFFVPKQYESATVIEPVADTSNNQNGPLGSIGSNLAALVGASGPSDARKTESVGVLQSSSLTRRYIEQNKLLPVLYAGKWDGINSRWKVSDPRQVPTLWKATEFFRKNVRTITTDTKSGLLTLTITWKDPAVASTWANGLVRLANDVQRESAIAESERNIAYLSNEAAKTDVVGIKQSIYALLQQEYGKAMLAKGNDQYAFKIIDGATTPERPSYPEKIVWVLTTLFTALSLSLFVTFCAVVWSKI